MIQDITQDPRAKVLLQQTTQAEQIRRKEGQEGFSRIYNEPKSAMTDFLSRSDIEGWRDEAYIPEAYRPITAADQESGLADGRDNGVMFNRSGVTLGAGIDVGQHSADSFLKMGVEPYLVDKLSAFGAFSEQGAYLKDSNKYRANDNAAFYALGRIERSPTPITRAESIHISNAFVAAGENSLREKMPEGRYDELTQGQKQVTNSLLHLYGPDFFGHNGFIQIVDGNWEALIKNLNTYQEDGGNQHRNTSMARIIDSERHQLALQNRTSRT